MKNLMVFFALISISLISCKSDSLKESEEKTKIVALSPANALVAQMVNKVGTYDKWKALNDVEYTYTYHDKGTDQKDISLERYKFDGEKSYAEYVHHKRSVHPDLEGKVVQGYDGKKAWVMINGIKIDDPQALKLSDFLRKTNYYWLTMMPKLLDPGLVYSSLKSRKVGGMDYDIVKITFDTNIGDVQDEYLLYINPMTGLVDQFLFTVKDFNKTEPLLMKVEYSQVKNLLLPTKRSYIQSNWQGDIIGETWIDEISENIKFNNGFSDDMFAEPM